MQRSIHFGERRVQKMTDGVAAKQPQCRKHHKRPEATVGAASGLANVDTSEVCPHDRPKIYALLYCGATL